MHFGSAFPYESAPFLALELESHGILVSSISVAFQLLLLTPVKEKIASVAQLAPAVAVHRTSDPN
jgi:hypothetical protein